MSLWNSAAVTGSEEPAPNAFNVIVTQSTTYSMRLVVLRTWDNYMYH